VAVVLISPQGKAHLSGCPHKGDDPDYGQWGETDIPGAWERICGGQPVRATSGARRDLVAVGPCLDCKEHGPWEV